MYRNIVFSYNRNAMASIPRDIVSFYTVGVFFGVLNIKINPTKIHSADGPFEVSFPLLIYSFAVWTCFLIVIFQLYIDFRLHHSALLPALEIMFGVVNTYFVIFFCIQRKSFAIIYNKMYSLHIKFPSIIVTKTDLVRLMFPIGLYCFKIIFDYDWYIQTPVFHIMGVFYTAVFFIIYGTLYCWLVYGDKLLREITININLNYQSARMMKEFITSLLDVEEFVRLITKYFGIFHLIIGLQVVVVYIGNLSSKLMIISNIDQYNKTSISILIHIAEWNIFMYIMFVTVYQSHKITLQVQKLRNNLEEVQFKNKVDEGALRNIWLIKKRLSNEEIIFSAFDSVHFDFQMAIVVLNTIITFISTITSLSWHEDNT